MTDSLLIEVYGYDSSITIMLLLSSIPQGHTGSSNDRFPRVFDEEHGIERSRFLLYFGPPSKDGEAKDAPKWIACGSFGLTK